MKRVFSGVLLSLVCSVSCVFAQDNKNIVVTNAWAQAVPAMLTVSAVYMDIANNTKAPIVLVSASTPAAETVEMHHMGQDGSMMTMQMIQNISIPAGSRVVLKPGGDHLMLIHLMKPIHLGDEVSLTLHFKDGSTVLVNARVKQQEENASSMPGMNM